MNEVNNRTDSGRKALQVKALHAAIFWMHCVPAIPDEDEKRPESNLTINFMFTVQVQVQVGAARRFDQL